LRLYVIHVAGSGWSIRGLMVHPGDAERKHICCGPYVAAHSFTPGSPRKAPFTSPLDLILVLYHQHLPLDSWTLAHNGPWFGRVVYCSSGCVNATWIWCHVVPLDDSTGSRTHCIGGISNG
jgi:hypothetical protein